MRFRYMWNVCRDFFWNFWRLFRKRMIIQDSLFSYRAVSQRGVNFAVERHFWKNFRNISVSAMAAVWSKEIISESGWWTKRNRSRLQNRTRRWENCLRKAMVSYVRRQSGLPVRNIFPCQYGLSCKLSFGRWGKRCFRRRLHRGDAIRRWMKKYGRPIPSAERVKGAAYRGWK